MILLNEYYYEIEKETTFCVAGTSSDLILEPV